MPVRTFAQKISFLFGVSTLLATFLVQAPGCGPTDTGSTPTPPRSPVLPDPVAVTGANSITQNIPGASVTFSGNTGQISMVTSPGLANPVNGNSPIPLAESRGTDEAARAGSMLEFFNRHKSAFNLTDVTSELRLARDPINDLQNTPPGAQARDLGQASGMQIQHLHRTLGGVHVYGQFATGVFDGQGNLQGLIMRLLPIDASLNVTPSFNSTSALARVLSSTTHRKVVTFTLDGKIQSVDAAGDSSTSPDDHAEELILLPIERDTGRMGAVSGNVDYRLVYEVRIRAGAERTHSWIDAVSGEIIDHRSDTPSGWWDQGADQIAGANDESNNFQLFLTDNFSGNWYMALTGNGFSSNWLAAGSFMSLDNLYSATNRNQFPATPMSIPTSVKGQDNYWNNDATFNANTAAGKQLRQSGHFIANLSRAEDWYSARNWIGWDGQGGTFYAAIGMKKSAGTSEDLNAWGGNGTLGLGGAPTATNQFIGSSPMVVGHEFTHSFITATSKLEYHDEPGATNEALADIFGKAITSVGDTFDSTVVGGDVGFPIRDMGDPTIYGQPDRYSNYVTTTSDSNGVHTNSGIFNKAHGLLVMGGTFNKITVGKIGMAETEKVLRLANVFKTFPATASMEEFANGVMDMCHITDAINQIFGDKHYANICKQFQAAYEAVEVLPRYKLIEVLPSWLTALNLSTMQAGIANLSYLPADLSKIKVTLIDSNLNETQGKVTQVVGSDGQTATTLNPGERAKLMVTLPDALANSQVINTSKLKVRIELDGDGLPTTDNYLKEISTVVGSDFEGVKPVYTYTVGQPVELGVAIENRTGSSYPAGLGAALLVRSTSYGPLMTAGEASLGAAVTPTMGPITLNLSSALVQNATLSVVRLLQGSEIPGMPGRFQAWFDSKGGLPETNDRSQYYVLVDPRSVTTELNKTNNLICLNCRVPGQAQGDTNGVIIRMPYNAPVVSLFPIEFQAAAVQLLASFRIPFQPRELLMPRLNFKTVIAPH